ncbi:MAG: BMP family ABC transporter substrate-binding protein [Desulfovibrio sp.]|nr:MAG: BMP family ABC transporter substrate-binding protein [Desulfovibrio sp.]
MRKGLAVMTCLALALMITGAAWAQQDKVKAAFVLLETIDDQGWTTAHYNGIEYLQEQLGDKVEISFTENVMAPADAERVIRDYAAQGYDVIFATTFTHMEPMVAVAPEFQDTVFMHCSGYMTADNLGTYFVRMYQAEYLAGYTAGLMGYKNVGTVATHPIPEVVRGINAFTLGLERGLTESGTEFDPDKVNTVVWLQAWRDPINETTLAETLVAGGHDLIRQMADTADSSLAACAGGVPAIGYGTDAAFYGADCALVSTVLNWGPVYTRTVEQVLAGTWETEQYWGGMDEQGAILSPFGASVPPEVQEKVLAAQAEIEAGNDTIFTGPIMNQAGEEQVADGVALTPVQLLAEMNWFVQGVSGSLPE